MISSSVKANLPLAIKSEGINILEIDENLERLSAVLHHGILCGLEEYGLAVPQFYITNVMLPEDDPNFRRMKELHTVGFQARLAQADALVKAAEADAEASVTAARRKIEMERQVTKTEVARHEAERELIRVQAEAEAAKVAGFAEAEVMRAKGYTEKDVLNAEVQKAYAEGIGNMNIGGGSVAGDMVGLGVGMAAAGAIQPQVGEMFKGIGASTEEKIAPVCSACGHTAPVGAKFCPECGQKL